MVRIAEWLAVVIALLPAQALGQAEGSSPAVQSTDVMSTDIQAAFARALQDLKPGVSVSDHNISLADIGKYNVTVAVVARPAGTFQNALSHDKITEIYYVLKGAGTQVTGTIVNGTRGANVSKTIGPTVNSNNALQDSHSRKLGPGDIQIIPPGLGHVFTSIEPGGIQYLIFRVDPDHVLGVQQ